MNLLVVFIFLLFVSVIITLFCILKENKKVTTHKKFFDFVPIVLFINLNHRKDRLDEFKSNFPVDNHNKLVRIEAIHDKKNGAVGCLKSHIIALEYALKHYKKNKYVLICEDDFFIKDMEYCEQMISYFFNNKRLSTWDVLMLGHNTSSHKKTKLKNVIRVQESQTTSAYIIKTKYISNLLNIYKSDLQSYEQSGVWGNYFTDQSWKKLQKIHRWYAINPRVGVQRKSFSDIENGIVNYNI